MKKRFFSILLCLCMVLGLLPTMAWAEEKYTTPSGLSISGGTSGMDYTYDDSYKSLDITGNDTYTISGSSTEDIICVNIQSDSEVNIILNNVNLDASSNAIANNNGFAAFEINAFDNATMTVNLTLIGDNVLKSGSGLPGLLVPKRCTLNITDDSTGTLTAVGGSGGAGIGGNASYDCGIINIGGGNVNAVGGGDAVAIGCGSDDTNGTLKGLPGIGLLRTPTVVTLEDITDAGVEVSNLTIKDIGNSTYDYGSTTRTLENGELYLWLPSDVTVTDATVTDATGNDTHYCGSVTSGVTGTLSPAVVSVATDSTTSYYGGISDALTAAQSGNASTLTLLKDVSYDSNVYLSNTMTLELNGHQLAFENGKCLTIDSTGNLTVQDSVGGGVITSDGVTLTALGGLTVKSGTIQTTATGSDALTCVEGSNVVIHGGTFIGTGKDVTFSGGNLMIDGGSFCNSGLLVSGAGVTLKGGTFATIETQGGLKANALLPNGYCYYQGNDTTGAVVDGDTTNISETVTVGECDWDSAIAYNDGTYTVLSADGLDWVSAVASGTITADTFQTDPQMPDKDFDRGYFYGATVKLDTNIDLSGENWTPMKGFGGTFDGAGHSITGMTVEGAYDQSGFFASLAGKVRNLYIGGSVHVSSDSDIYAGGIAGFVSEYGSIYNCVSGVTVMATGSQAVYTGGLTGWNSGYIKNCILQEDTSGKLIGKLGDADGSMENCYTPVGTKIADSDEASPRFTSVGTYDTSGNLTPITEITLGYGATLSNAMKYWVNRQVDIAVENEGEVCYVAWTTDAIPSLTANYAQQETHTFTSWEPQTDGGYIRTDLHTGITQTAEAVVTPSSGTVEPYATLEEAITAAKGLSGSTVKLITNVTTEKTIEVASGTFQIDLNGKTWESIVGDNAENEYALVLTGTSNITLKDSASGGTFTSYPANGCSTVRIAGVSATIEGGIYNTTNGAGRILEILDVVSEGKKVTITGGSFEGESWIIDSKYVELSGGSFDSLKVWVNENVSNVIGNLDGFLADGYAYRSTLEGNAWFDARVGSLTDVSVQAAPVKITAQPQDVTVTYGHTTSPTLSVITQRLVPEGDITYQWFLDEKLQGTSASLSFPTTYAAGSYTYYCAVTCDGCTVNSKSATVTVNRATGYITNKETEDSAYPTTQTYPNTAIAPNDSNFETNAQSNLVYTWYAGQNTDGSVSNLTQLTPNVAPANAGEYTLKVEFEESDNVAAGSTTLKVTINKATPHLGKVFYGGSGTLYTSAAPSAVVLTRDDDSCEGNFALDGVTALTAGTNDYPWKFTPTDTDNYDTVTGTVSLTVTADTLNEISIGSTKPSKTAYQYGDTFDTDGLTVTATYLSGAQKDVTPSVTANALAVGNTTATLNYTEDGVTKSCTVSGISVAKKQLNVSGMSWNVQADDYTFNGSEQGITLEGTLPTGVIVSKSQDTGTNVGDYDAQADFVLAEGYSADNYEIVGTNPLTVTWSIIKASAPNVAEQSKNHICTIATKDTVLLAALLPQNGGVPAYEVTSSSYTGLENVSVSTDGILSYDTKVAPSVLTDTITIKVTMENYDDTTITVKVNLTDKIGVIISGLSAPTDRVYNGMAVASMDFGIPTYAPLWNGTPIYTYYNGNSVSGSPLSEAPKDAGTYTLRISIPDDDTTYVGYADITFTIGKATVIANVDNKSMKKGSALPQFTVSYTGIASGDTPESIFETPATASTTADGKTTGSYPITVTAPVLKSEMEKNYIVGTTVNGTLTVKKPSSDDSAGGTTGGSTGGSTGVAPTSNTNTAQISSGTDSISASASVTGNTATVSATDAQIKEIVSDKETGDPVKIDVSGLKVDTVVVPSKVIAAMNSTSGSVGLEAVLSSGTVALDKTAVSAIVNKGDIKISVETVANSALSDAQKAVLGKQANSATVVDVNVYVNGIKTSTFGDGKIEVCVPYTLKAGENADSITVWFVKDDGTIEPKNGTYKDGKVVFTTDHLSQYLIVNFPFADVNENSWYYGSVAYAYTNGLFSGTSKTTFGPDTAMTREMIWMVLARMDDKAPGNMDGARTWAVENKISDGSNPKGIITREQLAAILYRYSEYKGYNVTVGDNTLNYSDAAEVSKYAISAVQWACNSQLLKGDSNKLLPSGTAERAQVAAILMRFCQNVAK
ncbi:endoglucanase precursor [Anaerotignum neopropionicum]|uniref:Endoglucanase n=1 Tax=Anaerotignum neopropionicum TaxID=36847 RepID=A0A136WD45_9FIRM|nr:S-layer homology domain-containing protein [Anaerotignum neopropionicum]KXL52259.1 endoglucanase precursor [Anaerotignum neopropionicum]